MEKSELQERIFGVMAAKFSESTAREMAEKAADLAEKMKYREVSFSFLKSDGTVREAKGTTNPDVIPPQKETTRTREPNYGVINYWDIEKNSWRCFKVENLISYE